MRGHKRSAAPAWWVELVDDYMRFLRRRNRRPNTQASYRSELMDLGEWLLAHDVRALAQLTKRDIEAWQDDVERRVLPATQRVAANAARSLLKWAAFEELEQGTPNLWLHVAAPRVPQLLPRPIPVADLRLILQEFAPVEPADIWRLRTRALFLVIFSSGCRINEALALHRDSFRDGAAVVIQKGGRPHTLLITAEAQAAIADYLARRQDSGPSLFASLDPRTLGGPLLRPAAQHAWDRLATRLGIPRFTSHQIRHACATALLRNEVNHLVIAKHLGHRGLQTIQNYAEVVIEQRRAAVAALEAGRRSA